jgi:hypothetical protein
MTGVACEVCRPMIRSAPAVHSDAHECEEGLADDYPLLGRHLAQQYRAAGTIAVEGEPRILVVVEANRASSDVNAYPGLSCYR